MSIACSTCGGPPEVGVIAHPLHYPDQPGVGKGECRYEQIVYCPNCEEPPNFHGSIEYYETTMAQEVERAAQMARDLAGGKGWR